MTSPVGPLGQERKFINTEGAPKRQQHHNHNDPRWIDFKDKIGELYSCVQLRLVREIMWCIYDFKK